jgi:hypothetical protein
MLKTRTSQFGEDTLLDLVPGEVKYLELGSWQPIAHSNSFYLKGRGMGVHIEPNPAMAVQWRIFRKRDTFLNLAVGNALVPEFKKYYSFPRRFSVLNTFEESAMQKYATYGMKVAVSIIELVPITIIIEMAMNFLGKIDLLMTDLEGMDLQILKAIHADEKLDYKWILSEEDAEGGVQKFLEGNGYSLIGAAGPSKLFEVNREK